MSVTAAGAYSSRWGRLIPIAFVTYSLAYVDRANYSFGAAGGMAHELNIDAAASSLLGALFFLGYFFFQVPAAYYAEKRSAKELIFWSLILWGVFAAATGMLTDIRLLYVDRFLLGVTESVVLPGMLIFLGHWFTRAERSRANTFLILGNPITVLWMSIVSGYLVQAFGWRGMFILEGAPPIIWAFVWRAMVEDWPRQAAWLDPDERYEQAVSALTCALLADAGFAARFERFLAELLPLGEHSALGQLLLKLCSPGIPDIFQGDELWRLSLVDPDNRRRVDWVERRAALARVGAAAAPAPGDRKIFLIQRALELRSRRPQPLAGAYTPLDGGPHACAFLRGDAEVLATVALRRPTDAIEISLPPSARGLWRDVLGSAERELGKHVSMSQVLAGPLPGIWLLERR